jgi:hypothetical protein
LAVFSFRERARRARSRRRHRRMEDVVCCGA